MFIRLIQIIHGPPEIRPEVLYTFRLISLFKDRRKIIEELQSVP